MTSYKYDELITKPTATALDSYGDELTCLKAIIEDIRGLQDTVVEGFIEWGIV